MRGAGTAAGGVGVPLPFNRPPEEEPEEQAKKVAKVLAAIKGGSGPLESRLLTMAPGTTVDPVAKNTRDQVLEARKMGRLQAKTLHVMEQLLIRMAPAGAPPINALRLTNFQ